MNVQLATTWKDDLEMAATVSCFKVGESEKFIVLPSHEVRLTNTAEVLFPLIAARKQMFVRGGRIIELVPNDNNEIVLSVLASNAARSRFEKYGHFARWVKHESSGEWALKPVAIMSRDLADALLETEQALACLPKISGLINCPVCVAMSEGESRVIADGYDDATGLFITGGQTPPEVRVADAIRAIMDLLADFDFPSPGDQSRAVASLLTPALKLGGHLRGFVPADVAEADQSQSGKTYRQKIVAALYNERLSLVSCKSGGVGSIDETLDQRLVAGRPFIQFDNFRGKFDSPHLEAFLTCESGFSARVPYRGSIDIDPSRFFIFLTSNGVDLRPDMANRCNLIAIRKRPREFQFRTFPESGGTADALDHLRAQQPYYLGCVFAVVREWLRRGKQRTTETRHDMREWCQTLDWIVTNIFELAPLMDGHQEMQARVSTPALVFLRQICIAAGMTGRLGQSLRAGQLHELCVEGDVEIPGVSADRRLDEEHGRKIIGAKLADIFKRVGGGSDSIAIAGFCVQRSTTSIARTDQKGSYPSHSYLITRDDEKPSVFPTLTQ